MGSVIGKKQTGKTLFPPKWHSSDMHNSIKKEQNGEELGGMDSLARWSGLFLSTLAQRNVLGVPLKTKLRGELVRFSKSVNIKTTNNMQ